MQARLTVDEIAYAEKMIANLERGSRQWWMRWVSVAIVVMLVGAMALHFTMVASMLDMENPLRHGDEEAVTWGAMKGYVGVELVRLRGLGMLYFGAVVSAGVCVTMVVTSVVQWNYHVRYGLLAKLLQAALARERIEMEETPGEAPAEE